MGKHIRYSFTFKRFISALIMFSISFASFPGFATLYPIKSSVIHAVANQCSASSSPSSNKLHPRVGGVALNQAAKFLADMSEVTGAYYDQNLDRIVFVGKTNTQAPKLDKDDLAVAIKAIMFYGEIPWVSLEGTNPDPEYVDAVYSPGLENTKFGDVLLRADWKMKLYDRGTDDNNQPIISNVPGYKSTDERYYTNPNFNPQAEWHNISRKWITPKLITLKKDDAVNSFVFETTQMQVNVEAEGDNDPLWNQANQDQADHFTQNYDLYAQEIPEWADAKRLGQIAAIVKWINDSGISTDFYWARDYEPKKVETVKKVKKGKSKEYVFEYSNGEYIVISTAWIEGGADLFTANTYLSDSSGASSALKNASQSIPTTKEDIHWTFTKDGQQYDSVAVSADAFRSLGSFNTSETDMSFPTAGDLDLAFKRVYSSFSGGQYGVGRGWNVFPATLYDNNPTYPVTTFLCGNNEYPKKLALVSQTGGFESFTINDCNIGYIPDDPAYHSKILKNLDGTFTAILKDQTRLNFSTDYKLITIQNKNNISITYTYNSLGRLSRINDSKNHVITINYNSDNLISSISDWSGRTVNYTYDIDGNLLTVTDPNGGKTIYTYDSNFKLTTITDANGQVKLTNVFTDEAKLATQKNAINNTTSYSYDKVNRVITATDNQSPVKTTTTKYDSKGRVLEQADPLSNKIIYTYGIEFSPLTIKDKRGNTITNTYDTRGNLISVFYPDLKKINYQYDSNNRLTQVTDERYSPAKITVYTYDSEGNLIQTNESGAINKYTYDSTGEILTATDSLNHTSTFTRDSFGNKLTEKDALNNTSTFEYDSIGRLKKITDADAKIFSYTYDLNNNLLTEINAIGTTTNTYDKENRLVKTTLPNNTVTETTYNNSNSITSVKDALNNISSYTYDSYQNLIAHQDTLNNTTTSLYDLLNRQIQSTTPLGKLAKWEYDENGNITTRIDANNNTTTYIYDAFNRVTKITYPDTKTISFEYDNRGNRIKMIDPTGTSTYSYDNFDRLIQATNVYGHIIKYQYDSADNLTKITYPDDTGVIYTFDNNDRLISAKDWNNKVTTYTYNKNGTISTRIFPNTIKTTYTYDSANRLKDITHTKSTTTVAKFAYARDSIGNIISVTESGSYISSTPKTTTFMYDALGRLLKATYPNSNTYTYTYDKMGNRLSQQAVNDYNDGTFNNTYVYDNDYKLIKKDSFTNFSYDSNGNMTKKPSENFNPDPLYTYDFENRLNTHKTAVGNLWQYTYDGDGNRVQSYFSTAIERYVTDVSQDLPRTIAIASGYGGGGITEKFIYGLGILSSNGSQYYLEDGLGNVRLTTNTSGGKSGLVAYDPFGRLRSFSDIAPFQFQGQWLDSESEMYYLRARHYDPELGRFIQKDPIKGTLTNSQTQNPYVYVGNNPINVSDPSGEFWGQVSSAILQKCQPLIQKAGSLLSKPSVQNTATKAQNVNKVYQNAPQQKTDYIGITNDFTRRAGEHLLKGRNIQQIKGLENLSREDARAVEQVLIERYGLLKDGGVLTNKINSISSNNPIYQDSIKKGEEILKNAGY